MYGLGEEHYSDDFGGEEHCYTCYRLVTTYNPRRSNWCAQCVAELNGPEETGGE